jgi:hypothetical protein
MTTRFNRRAATVLAALAIAAVGLTGCTAIPDGQAATEPVATPPPIPASAQLPDCSPPAVEGGCRADQMQAYIGGLKGLTWDKFFQARAPRLKPLEVVWVGGKTSAILQGCKDPIAGYDIKIGADQIKRCHTMLYVGETRTLELYRVQPLLPAVIFIRQYVYYAEAYAGAIQNDEKDVFKKGDCMAGAWLQLAFPQFADAAVQAYLKAVKGTDANAVAYGRQHGANSCDTHYLPQHPVKTAHR